MTAKGPMTITLKYTITMKNSYLRFAVFSLSLFLFWLIAGCASKGLRHRAIYDFSRMDKSTIEVYKTVDVFLQEGIRKRLPVRFHSGSKIDSVRIDPAGRRLEVHLSKAFMALPFREDGIAWIYSELRERLGKRYRDYRLTLYSREWPIEQLVPNYYRSDPAAYDRSRMPKGDVRGEPLVRNVSKSLVPSAGLYNRNVALWHSHGWYYEPSLDRWEWQRARVFQTIEDLLPASFTLPYLVPMLENAGANVFLPRERDIQVNEVIVDNDSADSLAYAESALDSAGWKNGPQPGFAVGHPPYPDSINPFVLGSSREIASYSAATAQITWLPEIPESGEYAVSIAYTGGGDRVDDARYIVYHAGGKTEFRINQQIGGSTWIYLGKFPFRAGTHPDSGRVVLTNQSRTPGNIISADAVRFGGGMGNVIRNGWLSGRPRFMEGARYYMQYAGMPDTLVYKLSKEPQDYTDDYRGRGEWVNYLRGAPYGPNRKRDVPGLGIPIDLSLAFHTDAGNSRSDTTIGTLMIYSSGGLDSATVFPDSVSRLASRDFGDILQSQLVDDIRARYDAVWRRRPLWNRYYSEAARPNVPAALLELLSHHNFLDMKFALDPQFRFDASRSIYKAILRFLATQYQQEYVVQPLPVSHFRAEFADSATVRLRWQAVADSLEPTANPENYRVYRRIGDGGFDNGTAVEQPEFYFDGMETGMIYSFKVTAVNAGGESFPSEILAVCRMDGGEKPVLIVNGFDRVSGPAALENGDLAGFADFWDQGVPDRYDFNYIGSQYDFTRDSKWQDDDAPGHGASHADFETTIISGNTFDFPYVHGRAIRAAGRSFVSASDEALGAGMVDLAPYDVIDLIMGEEKTTRGPKPQLPERFRAFPPELQAVLTQFLKSGKGLFISGAYIGSDLQAGKEKEHPDVQFGQKTLKFFWRTNHAALRGEVMAVDSTILPRGETFRYSSGYHPQIYTVESPDGIEPADSTARVILRYEENHISAGVAYSGSDYRVVLFGFPFEAILGEEARVRVMGRVLEVME